MNQEEEITTPLHTFCDDRGALTVVESGGLAADVPFDVKRVYWIYNVPQGKQRGSHANTLTTQYLVAVSGRVEIYVEYAGGESAVVVLDEPSEGLLLPPLTWNELRSFSSDAVLLVMSSHHYNAAAYINSHEEFVRLTAEMKK